MTKALHRLKIQKATWQHTNATKNFDYTTIADNLGRSVWVTIQLVPNFYIINIINVFVEIPSTHLQLKVPVLTRVIS